MVRRDDGAFSGGYCKNAVMEAFTLHVKVFKRIFFYQAVHRNEIVEQNSFNRLKKFVDLLTNKDNAKIYSLVCFDSGVNVTIICWFIMHLLINSLKRYNKLYLTDATNMDLSLY